MEDRYYTHNNKLHKIKIVYCGTPLRAVVPLVKNCPPYIQQIA